MRNDTRRPSLHRSGDRMSAAGSSPVAVMITLVACLALPGCNLLASKPQIEESLGLIAVMPIERAQTAGATASEGRGLAPNAERVITAQIYGVLSSSSEWRFVPDLTVAQALPKVRTGGDLTARALALGKAVGADGVLFGTAFKYVERVGSEYGAQQPAAVAFTLHLVSVTSGRTVWTGTFDQAQEPLTSNLFNWWQFWRAGPRWFTAQEFARLGVERVLEDLGKQLGH